MKSEQGLPAAYARVVVDTNVLLSAVLIRDSVPFIVVDRLLENGCLVFSTATFSEFETRIWKPKFDRYLSMEIRKRVLRDVDASAIWVDVPESLEAQSWSRDSQDDHFIRAALAAGASRLVTGDEDLLVLQHVDTLQIVTPRVALEDING